jgi:hypothetical protein
MIADCRINAAPLTVFDGQASGSREQAAPGSSPRDAGMPSIT